MALFKTVTDIKNYISVNVTTEFDTIKPYIEQAQIKFIKPVLGKILYNKLVDWVDSEDSDDSTGFMDDLLIKVKLPLIYYAYYLYAPIGNIQIGDRGFQIDTSETKKTAFEWQIDKVMESWLNTAHDFIEELILWLEEFVEEHDSDSGIIHEDIVAWANSDAYTISHDLFINTADDFNEEMFINKSRRLFVALRPIMKSIERKHILPVLGEDYYNELKNAIQDRKISSDNQVIINKIRPALAHLTISRALSEISVDILPEGNFINWKQGIINAKRPAGLNYISWLKQELKKDGDTELREVQLYLDQNANTSKYSTYYNSDKYFEDSDPTIRGEYENDTDSGIIVM